MQRQLSRLCCLALVLAEGCHTWRPEQLTPTVTRELPAHSRLVTRSGQRVNLASGRVIADSIFGEQSGGQRIALPRDSVTIVEVRSLSWPRTLGVVYGGLVVVGILIGEKF